MKWGLNVEGFHAPNDRTRVGIPSFAGRFCASKQGWLFAWIMWLLWPQRLVAMLAVPTGRTRHHHSRHRRGYRGRCCCCDFAAAVAAAATAAVVAAADFWAAADDG